ncbi:MAG TPA: hypothetical protein VLB84_11315, partial [Bacteroidia bacterium]|nr:hypothetical protein [Bacteroidia bacterium]
RLRSEFQLHAREGHARHVQVLDAAAASFVRRDRVLHAPTQKIAEQLIDKNMISFLGTDCHHMGHINLLKSVGCEIHLQKLIDSGKLENKNLL